MPMLRLDPEWFQEPPHDTAAQAARLTPQTPAPEEPPPPYDAGVPELAGRLRQALTELDELRSRYARQVADAQAAERARATAVWLPVLDNLELALAHAETEVTVRQLRAVRDQAVAVLATLGYPRYDATGAPFDPTRHEAVTVRRGGDTVPGTVLEVLRPGYGAADRQLRPAAVVVSAS